MPKRRTSRIPTGPSNRAKELMAALPDVIHNEHDGKFVDPEFKKPWRPSGKKATRNHEAEHARFYSWRHGYVVENVGYGDQHFRKMKESERKAKLVELRTGIEHTSPVSYSFVTAFAVVRDENPFSDTNGKELTSTVECRVVT